MKKLLPVIVFLLLVIVTTDTSPPYRTRQAIENETPTYGVHALKYRIGGNAISRKRGESIRWERFRMDLR